MAPTRAEMDARLYDDLIILNRVDYKLNHGQISITAEIRNGKITYMRHFGERGVRPEDILSAIETK